MNDRCEYCGDALYNYRYCAKIDGTWYVFCNDYCYYEYIKKGKRSLKGWMAENNLLSIKEESEHERHEDNQ